jgi:hypothetical protein
VQHRLGAHHHRGVRIALRAPRRRDEGDGPTGQALEVLTGPGGAEADDLEAGGAAHEAHRRPDGPASGATELPRAPGPRALPRHRGAAHLAAGELAVHRAGQEAGAAGAVEHADHPAAGPGGAHQLHEGGRVEPGPQRILPAAVGHVHHRPPGPLVGPRGDQQRSGGQARQRGARRGEDPGRPRTAGPLHGDVPGVPGGGGLLLVDLVVLVEDDGGGQPRHRGPRRRPGPHHHVRPGGGPGPPPGQQGDHGAVGPQGGGHVSGHLGGGRHHEGRSPGGGGPHHGGQVGRGRQAHEPPAGDQGLGGQRVTAWRPTTDGWRRQALHRPGRRGGAQEVGGSAGPPPRRPLGQLQHLGRRPVAGDAPERPQRESRRRRHPLADDPAAEATAGQVDAHQRAEVHLVGQAGGDLVVEPAGDRRVVRKDRDDGQRLSADFRSSRRGVASQVNSLAERPKCP